MQGDASTAHQIPSPPGLLCSSLCARAWPVMDIMKYLLLSTGNGLTTSPITKISEAPQRTAHPWRLMLAG